MKVVRWFVAAFGLAFGSAAAIVASADTGDLIYLHQGASVSVTAEQASGVALWAIEQGLWDGAPGGLRSIRVYACKSDTGFCCNITGVKTAAPADLPVGSGVRVVGIVE